MGAKVDGRMVPLRHKLTNGSTVEIITSPRQHPSKDWLEFVKTPRAKTKIRQWLRNQEKDESIILGKSILEKALVQEHLTLSNIIKSDQIASVAKELSFHSIKDLLAQIGLGKVSPNQVLGRLKPKLGIKEVKQRSLVSKVVGRLKRRKGDSGIMVKGQRDMLIHFANCCHPLPGEPVIGFITRGRGVTIHNRDCRHIQKAEPERLVEVSWEGSKEDVYLATLKVISENKKGSLADISSIMSRNEANIIQANIKTTVDNKGIGIFTIEVENYRQLQEIVRALKRLKNVLIVERL
jgi:GTP pyrophosphokinase